MFFQPVMEIIVEIPSEYKKSHFYCSSCQLSEPTAQKACEVSICGFIKKPNWTWAQITWSGLPCPVQGVAVK